MLKNLTQMMLLSHARGLVPNNVYRSTATPDPIFGNVAVSENQIPENCELWVNGCTSCGVRDRQLTICDMVVCQYSKCLPHCEQFKYNTDPESGRPIIPNSDIAPTCKVWFDGCNTCHMTPHY